MDSLRADGRRSRRAILDAASATVLEGGDLRFAPLARRAGVTRATVYRHFASPEDLAREVARELAAGYLEPLLADMDALPLPEAWRRLAELVVVEGRRHATLVETFGDVEQLARAAVADEPIEAWLRRRRERGDLTSPMPDDWTAAVVRSLCLSALADTARPAEEAVGILVRTLVDITTRREPPSYDALGGCG